MKRLMTAAGIAMLAFTLTACGQGMTASGKAVESRNVKLPDGGSVVCVAIGDGLSCDWDTARR